MDKKDLEKFIIYLDEQKKELDIKMSKNTIMRTGWQITRQIDAIHKTKIYIKNKLKNYEK